MDIDAEVAEKVMGLSEKDKRPVCLVKDHCLDETCWCYTCAESIPDIDTKPEERDEPEKWIYKPYSTDIAAAWDVVEKVGGKFQYWNVGWVPSIGKYRAVFNSTIEAELVEAFADTPAMAICKAALAAKSARGNP